MGDDTTTADGGLDECVELLISADGKLQVAGRDTLHLKILRSQKGRGCHGDAIPGARHMQVQVLLVEARSVAGKRRRGAKGTQGAGSCTGRGPRARDNRLPEEGSDRAGGTCLGGVACKLENLGSEVLEDGSRVHGGGSSDTAVGGDHALHFGTERTSLSRDLWTGFSAPDHGRRSSRRAAGRSA